MGQPTFNLDNFWFGDDDGTDETDNTFLGSKNSNQTLNVDTNYRIRVGVSNTGAKADAIQLQLEYNHNSGGWNPVNASSSVVQMAASTKLTEGNDCTERLAGAQTFDSSNAGQEDNDGLTGSNSLGINAEQEADYCFTIVSGDVVDTDTIELRVTDAGLPLDNYNQTPTITVNEPAGTTYYQSVAGTITPSGDPSIKTSPAAYTGSITPAGGLAAKALKALSGSITPSGAVTLKTSLAAFTGSLTPTGALTAYRTLIQSISGSLTPTGALTAYRTLVQSVSGSLTPTGGLIIKIKTAVAGILEPIGTVTSKIILAVFTGNLTPTGTLTAIKKFFISVSGALTPSGLLSILQKPLLSGEITPSGIVITKIRVVLSGALSSTGGVFVKIKTTLSGILTAIGDLVANIVVPSDDYVYEVDVTLPLSYTVDMELPLAYTVDTELNVTFSVDAELE